MTGQDSPPTPIFTTNRHVRQTPEKGQLGRPAQNHLDPLPPSCTILRFTLHILNHQEHLKKMFISEHRTKDSIQIPVSNCEKETYRYFATSLITTIYSRLIHYLKPFLKIILKFSSSKFVIRPMISRLALDNPWSSIFKLLRATRIWLFTYAIISLLFFN